ncbi:hypothetical protein KHA80_10675 [Anaerobacillus sp. HL2]|nr:hypothetical protein KHA80_10675 [Anaerobacillus sp. HL2]
MSQSVRLGYAKCSTAHPEAMQNNKVHVIEAVKTKWNRGKTFTKSHSIILHFTFKQIVRSSCERLLLTQNRHKILKSKSVLGAIF